jgi:hypothetical protein
MYRSILAVFVDDEAERVCSLNRFSHSRFFFFCWLSGLITLLLRVGLTDASCKGCATTDSVQLGGCLRRIHAGNVGPIGCAAILYS